MSRRGDLLALIDETPSALRTLQGTRLIWRHFERSRRAFEVMQPGGHISQAVLSRGGPLPETSQDHQRVAVELPNRWRIESSDRTDLSDGTGRWFGTKNRITYLDEESPSLLDTELAYVIHPGDLLLGILHFTDPVEDEVASRPCWKVEGQLARGRHRVHTPMLMQLGGIDHTLWFDAETGIILRRESRVEDQLSSTDQLDEVVINEPVGEEVFRFSPSADATVERRIDQMIRLAEQHGVDLSEIDRSDPEAVQKVVSETLNPSQPTPRRLTESRRAKHVPVGAPPDNQGEAYRQIEYAFAHHDETAEGSATLINVQSGENMAPLLDQARRRLPKSDPESVRTVVDDVFFLREDEAIVWFGIDIDGERFGFVNGREGRAVRVEGRWMMERATLVDLLAFAGVSYPPLSG